MQLIRNYLTMTIRTVKGEKLFSFISIFGLTVSMAVCMLIFQYVFFEMNYDRFHRHAEKTFRVYTSVYQHGEFQTKTALTPVSLAVTLKEELSNITEATRMVSTRWWFDCTLAYAPRKRLSNI